MQITLSDIEKNVYFIDRRLEKTIFVIEYGQIIGFTPKYAFRDKFAQNYSRCMNILISVLQPDGSVVPKVVNDDALVFETIEAVMEYCKGSEIVFGYSVLKGV